MELAFVWCGGVTYFTLLTMRGLHVHCACMCRLRVRVMQSACARGKASGGAGEGGRKNGVTG